MKMDIPLGYAPVVLLFPADSTLAFFGVTNDEGKFEIKSVRHGKYVLQATLMGHQTVFREITIPLLGRWKYWTHYSEINSGNSLVKL